MITDIDREISDYELNIRDQLLDNITNNNCGSLDKTAATRRGVGA
jgi:hypothetical protein